MTLQQMLVDAQEKLHQLMTGRLTVEIVADGYTVRYTRATVADLKSYIANLEAQLAGLPTKGAIGMVWSRS